MPARNLPPVECEQDRQRELGEAAEGRLAEFEQPRRLEQTADERRALAKTTTPPRASRSSRRSEITLDERAIEVPREVRRPESSIESEEDIIAAIAPAMTSAANHVGVYSREDQRQDVRALWDRDLEAGGPRAEHERGDEEEDAEDRPEGEGALEHRFRARGEEALVDLREHRDAEADRDRRREDPRNRVIIAAQREESVGVGVRRERLGRGAGAATTAARTHSSATQVVISMNAPCSVSVQAIPRIPATTT